MVELPSSPFRSRPLRNQWLFGLLIAFTAGLVVYVGGVKLFAAVTALLWLVAVAYRWPLVIAGLALLQSGDFLQFLSTQALPSLAIGPGLRFNVLDILVLVSLPIALVRLNKRHERPVFTWAVLSLIGAATLSVSVGLAFGSSSQNGAIGGLFRTVFYYTMYFVLVAAIDTKRKLDGWIKFLLGIVVVACGLQLVEAAIGRHLEIGLSHAYIYSFGSEGRLAVGEQYTVLYLWNRATLLSFLGLMLALGVVVGSRPVSLRYFWLTGLLVVSFALAFVRQWFVYVVVGVAGVLLAQRTGRTRGVLAVALVGGVVVLAIVAGSPLLRASYGPSLVGAWLARAGTLLTSGGDSANIIRMRTMAVQWDLFLQSPLVGHGQTIGTIEGTYSSDVGITNTLVETGLLGLLAVTVLWASFLATALKMRSTIDEAASLGYLIGLIGFWLGVLAGSLYGVNYFSSTAGVFVIVVALALVDRFRALHSPATEVRLARRLR